MPRHRKRKPPADPAPVLVVCRDPFHRDTKEYRRLGYHLLGEVRQDPTARGGLAWTGHASEEGPLRTSGITLVWGVSPGLPAKRYRRDDGQPTYRFRCECGLDVQRSEPDLAAIVARWRQAFPGRPAEVDIARLRE